MTNSTSSPPRRRRRKRKKETGNCKLWLRMRDSRHEKGFTCWGDPRHKGSLLAEVKQLKAAKIRFDQNPKYPGPVGMAIIYDCTHDKLNGTPIATFNLEKGGWDNH